MGIPYIFKDGARTQLSSLTTKEKMSVVVCHWVVEVIWGFSLFQTSHQSKAGSPVFLNHASVHVQVVVTIRQTLENTLTPKLCEGFPAGHCELRGGWLAQISHTGLEPCCWKRRGGNRGNAPETQHRLTRMEWTFSSSTKSRLPEPEKICRMPSSPLPRDQPDRQGCVCWARVHPACNTTLWSFIHDLTTVGNM